MARHAVVGAASIATRSTCSRSIALKFACPRRVPRSPRPWPDFPPPCCSVSCTCRRTHPSNSAHAFISLPVPAGDRRSQPVAAGMAKTRPQTVWHAKSGNDCSGRRNTWPDVSGGVCPLPAAGAADILAVTALALFLLQLVGATRICLQGR